MSSYATSLILALQNTIYRGQLLKIVLHFAYQDEDKAHRLAHLDAPPATGSRHFFPAQSPLRTRSPDRSQHPPRYVVIV
jgi:hypothetical protein